MKPKTELAIKVMKSSLKKFGFSEKELFEATFHLTDWIEELKSFVGFLENPDKYNTDQVQTILIAFLIHAPDHLKRAAEIILEDPGTARKKKSVQNGKEK